MYIFLFFNKKVNCKKRWCDLLALFWANINRLSKDAILFTLLINSVGKFNW